VRLSPDRRLGRRLTLALIAVFALGVPFAVLLLLVRGKFAPLLDLDQDVATGLHRLALRHPPLVRTFNVLSTVFDPNVFRVIGTGLAVWLLVDHRPRLAGWTLVTTWGGALLGVVVKAAVARARPIFDVAVATAPGRSFPSGHALGSVVGCGVLLLVLLPLVGSRLGRWLCWAAAATIVLAVGFARVGLGVHYLTDVAGGWVLGLAWLAAATAAFQAWRRDLGAPPAEPVKHGLEPEIGEPEIGEPGSGKPRPAASELRGRIPSDHPG
jgi:membrane-associated phospholipid phosphatase